MARSTRRTGPEARAREAAKAWGSIITLFSGAEHQARFLNTARTFGLTPASMKALMHIEPGPGVPMRGIADFLHCDASNVTQLVDALEEPGYVERVPSSQDRRVKLVRLTRAGTDAREGIITELHTPPVVLREALSVDELGELAALLQKVVEHEQATDASGPVLAG